MTGSDLPAVFASLQPSTVWRHFAQLCAIPRASKAEAALRAELWAWAAARGLATTVDAVGNLLICKPASAGCAHAPGIVLQAHLDMVCQKNAETVHDFARDPIAPVLRDGWLLAEGTTLGADNGIGVALMLAVLEDAEIVHGPLEALFTVDEEAGMGGARGLAPDLLQGSLMLNLDTEEWGEFYLGCAGGLDVNVARAGLPAPLPAGWEGWRIELGGLRGGHSGVNIHEGRGNAIKLLVRVLRELEQEFPLRLASLSGGTARNALPREAVAILALPVGKLVALEACLGEIEAELRQELCGVDDGVCLSLVACDVVELLAPAEQTVWLASLHAAPNGVRRMSRALPGVVETSNNLGMIDVQPAGGSCNFMLRSLQDSGSLALAAEINSLFALSGTSTEQSDYYPGWTPNPASPLLALCQQVYRREFEAESSVQVIHAGLECGIIGAKYPGLDIVSFGPTIRGAHAPGEAVEVIAVERCWHLLRAILAGATCMPSLN
ncbi:aminoacyl-histidine dipeptidase [Quatrionicoccus australiensis]|uniref:aminoacyl-histidine dipeptidase n=1 Tax=Quatrionicoccus australiensis TaxID=138118 RepID=UPI001CF857FC|nr:aminoacyl-histidine dipeptidase [Quatrionicoccus australiensis]UCV13843.1 aminoacyl-histidine dipeptidase [Quatrionicoccus australiensis]